MTNYSLLLKCIYFKELMNRIHEKMSNFKWSLVFYFHISVDLSFILLYIYTTLLNIYKHSSTIFHIFELYFFPCSVGIMKINTEIEWLPKA